MENFKIAFCISGLFTPSSTATNAEVNNFNYLRQVIEELRGDTFIFSFSKDSESYINNLFKPKKSVFVENLSFEDEISKIDFIHNPIIAKNTFSCFYSRKKVCELMNEYEKNNNFTYDIVFLVRPDLSYHNFGNNKTSYLPESILSFDYNKLISCHWEQINAGPSDHWFISNSKNIKFLSLIYDELYIYLNSQSEYFKLMTNNWPFSSHNEFSNEIFSKNPKNEYTVPIQSIINNHYIIKYYLLKNNKYHLDFLDFKYPKL